MNDNTGRMIKSKEEKRVEALLRSRVPHFEEYYDLLAYELDPLGGFRLCRNQRLPHVTINQHSYRGRPFSGEETVLLLGDSVTFGVGSSGDEAIFGRFLEHHSGRMVADASVRAYRVCQHFVQLPALLSALPRTQRVVLWCGFVDLLFWSTTGGYIEGTLQLEKRYAEVLAEVRLPLVLRRFLALAKKAVRRMIKMSLGVEQRTGKYGSLHDLVQFIVIYVEAIRNLCVARHIDLVVLVQPFVRCRPSDHELQVIADYYSRVVANKCGISWYQASQEYIKPLMKCLVQLENVRVIDCQELVDETDFLDQVHLKEEALRKLAHQLAQLDRSGIYAIAAPPY